MKAAKFEESSITVNPGEAALGQEGGQTFTAVYWDDDDNRWYPVNTLLPCLSELKQFMNREFVAGVPYQVFSLDLQTTLNALITIREADE